jgi:hypothetical protein
MALTFEDLPSAQKRQKRRKQKRDERGVGQQRL